MGNYAVLLKLCMHSILKKVYKVFTSYSSKQNINIRKIKIYY